jgi:hypothetical protein
LEEIMTDRQKSPVILVLTLFFFSFFGSMAGCGGNMMNMTMSRQLQSIALTPASAMAQNFSNKQVQFTAMGNYNMTPMTGMPQVLWSIGNPFSTQPVPAGVTVNSSGMAQCTTFTGTVTIQATAPADPGMPLSQMNMMTMKVAGMAQFTCP